MTIKTLDVRGEICPDPLTLTMQGMEGLSSGDQLKVTLDAPIALETITRWAEKAGHRVLDVREEGAGQWVITLESVE